jgi:uncharacterized protein YegP (UPF0339 family)
MKTTAPRLHIRTTISGKWIWELRTPDKHTVNVSEGFSTRAECEADAKANGLEVTPRRGAGAQITLTVVPVSEEPGQWSIYEDDSGLWHWKRSGEGEDFASRCAFLTRRECVADAHEHGYRAEQVSRDDIEAG